MLISHTFLEYPGFDQLTDNDTFVDCPVNLLIPEHIHGDVTTPAPIPGEPGPQGPPGPQVRTIMFIEEAVTLNKNLDSMLFNAANFCNEKKWNSFLQYEPFMPFNYSGISVDSMSISAMKNGIHFWNTSHSCHWIL